MTRLGCRTHGRDWQPGLTVLTDLVAVVVAGAAVVLDGRIIVGAVAVVAVVVVQQVRRRRPVAPVKIIGMSQMALGFAVVAASATGVASL